MTNYDEQEQIIEDKASLVVKEFTYLAQIVYFTSRQGRELALE